MHPMSIENTNIDRIYSIFRNETIISPNSFPAGGKDWNSNGRRVFVDYGTMRFTHGIYTRVHFSPVLEFSVFGS